MMKFTETNPWIGFTKSNKMVHPLDQVAVEHHNKTSKRDYQFILHLAPEPWIGNIEAKLLVLYSNPGATKSNALGIFQPLHDLVLERSIRNLNQENQEYPHFDFDPELNETEGAMWFHKRFRWLVDIFGVQKVSQQLLTCELSPYHSLKWKIPKLMPPTQNFTYQIIREAMLRNATILLARTPKLWMENVPELATYPYLFRPKSINAAVSPNNYPDNFEKILEALR